MRFRTYSVSFFLLIAGFRCCWAQKPFPADYDGIAASVLLDSFTVTAKAEGFDVEDFIEMVQKDSSFAQAFENLRLIEHSSQHELQFYDKKNRQKAGYSARTRQIQDGRCRTMEFLQEKASGNFFKKQREYRYITAKLYDKVFFTHGRQCVAIAPQKAASKGLQKYYEELKQFVFQPGEAIDVPLVGGKTAIFSEKLQQFYDYAISSKVYKDGTPCFVFTVSVKPEYQDNKTGKTLLKFMETYFARESFQVMGRRYRIEYSGLASCEVYMEVDLIRAGAVYLPGRVSYEGQWNIPGKKKEIAAFTALIRP